MSWRRSGYVAKAKPVCRLTRSNYQEEGNFDSAGWNAEASIPEEPGAGKAHRALQRLLGNWQSYCDGVSPRRKEGRQWLQTN